MLNQCQILWLMFLHYVEMFFHFKIFIILKALEIVFIYIICQLPSDFELIKHLYPASSYFNL